MILLYYMQAPNRSPDDATDGNTEENTVEDSERDDANDTTEPLAPPPPPPGPSAATVAYNFVTSFFTSLFPTGPAVQNWFIGGDLLTRIETWNSTLTLVTEPGFTLLALTLLQMNRPCSIIVICLPARIAQNLVFYNGFFIWPAPNEDYLWSKSQLIEWSGYEACQIPLI